MMKRHTWNAQRINPYTIAVETPRGTKSIYSGPGHEITEAEAIEEARELDARQRRQANRDKRSDMLTAALFAIPVGLMVFVFCVR